MPGGVETPRSAKQRSLPFLINRYSVSAQIRMLEAAGFETVMQMRNHGNDGMSRPELSAPWKDMSNDEVTCGDLFVQARKRE